MPPQSTKLPLHILFVFIDGVGLGQELPDFNPLSQLKLPAFSTLGKNQQWIQGLTPVQDADHVFKPIDACLSVDGLPQSGTGQATLFTGKNCAKIAGRHFGPYPHSTSKPVIATDNIFTQVQRVLPHHPEPNAFANAYPPPFFKHATARNRWTVTTLSCIEAGIPIRKEPELERGHALTADITGNGWKEKLNMPIQSIDESEAAKRLASIASSHPFTLFEYYLTDKAGHSRDITKASTILHSLDRFFAGLMQHIDFSQTLLLITSDHGNIEDLSTKSHTINPVPFIALGNSASYFNEVRSLMDVTPTLVETLRKVNSTSTRTI